MTAVGAGADGAAVLTDIVSAVDDRTPQGIAATLSRLVGTGLLRTGARLPTVRELAGALGTSPTTVSAAWQALAARGVIESRGRLGTFVLARRAPRTRPCCPTSARRCCGSAVART